MTPTMPDIDLLSGLSDDSDEQTLERLRARLVSSATSDGLLDISYRHLDTPVGDLLIATTRRGLVRIAYARENHDEVLRRLGERISPRILLAPARLDQAAHELDDYFTGARKTFDLPLDLELASGFRYRVLEQLRQLDYGQTASYSAVAHAVGNPNAVRAVGSACAHNPLPVIIPCHRVVRSDGAIGNYLRGQEAKLALLKLERSFNS